MSIYHIVPNISPYILYVIILLFIYHQSVWSCQSLELDLFVCEPEDDVPADQPQTAGHEAFVEGRGSLGECEGGAVKGTPVLASRGGHVPGGTSLSYCHTVRLSESPGFYDVHRAGHQGC